MSAEYTFGLWSRHGRQRIYFNDGRRKVGWYDPVSGEKGIRGDAEAYEVDDALVQFVDRISVASLAAVDDPTPFRDAENGLTGPDDLAENRPGDLVPGQGWTHVMGVEGELQTAGMLSTLHHRGFKCLHAIELSGAKDVDHLVIGPTGVFTINSKKTSYQADINDDGTVSIHGYRNDWLRDAARDARIVQRRLSEASGLDLVVEGLVCVWTGDHPIGGFHQQVVPGEEISDAIVERHPVLTAAAVDIIYGIARLPRTWT